MLDTLLDFFKQNIWLVCVVIAGILVLAVVLLIVQWKRVSYRKHHPKIVDWSADAKREIEQARQMLENGLIRGLRNELGDRLPDNSDLLQKYVSDAYGLRAGGLYISVDALSAFVHHMPRIFLQGSDNVGGVSVLPLMFSESGERFFYLENLSICYRNEEQRFSTRYHIRFYPNKTDRPIEEVLEFEIA